mgnify:CR=1 FL=1
MDGIITLAILFFVINFVIKMVKKAQVQAKQQQTQAQIEATKPRPVPKSAPKREDFRFPSRPKPAPAPTAQEGRDPSAVLSTYTPISPSKDLQKSFSDYQGSLNAPAAEGLGYTPEEFDDANEAYQTVLQNRMKILPESFNRDTLVRAVVMSEILKRPGVRR